MGDEVTNPGHTVTFLGTAGARVMVASQILASGGLWFNLGGTEMLLDPAPGTLVRACKSRLSPPRLSAILLSHKHIDHSCDINVMIEAMAEGGFHRRGVLMAPADALDNDPVVLHYVRPFLERIEVLKEGGEYQVENVSIRTPVRHVHPVETYGLILRTEKHTISCVVDTRYFDQLCQHYRADLLILNVMRLEPTAPLDHLSVPDAARIIKSLKPRAALLNHFGMSMWRAKPWTVAQRLTEETGIRVIAASDGLRFDLAELR
jgi:ribonuclease BN (tRNA processing enzyme)